MKPAAVHARLTSFLPPTPHPPPSSSLSTSFRLNYWKWRLVFTKFFVRNNGYRYDICRNFRCCASSIESETSDSSSRTDSSGVFPPWFRYVSDINGKWMTSLFFFYTKLLFLGNFDYDLG